MSSEAAAAAQAPDKPAPPHAALTAGATLRNARENAGLHIGALAVALKVPVKKLEALESDRIDLLPDTVFARALASSVCRNLKLDPGSVLSLLPGQAVPRLKLGARLSGASFDTPSMGWRLPLLSRLPRAVVITASLLVIAALALLFLPSIERMRPPPASAKVTAGASASASNTARASDVPAFSAAPAAAISAATPPPLAGAVVGAPVNLATEAPLAAAFATAGASAAAANPGTDAVAGLVVFKARGSSWVEVTDASGVVQLRKTMGSGETAGASGALPLSVTVGRADSIDVLVRGKSFDLAPVVKDNVARFQIK